jgi:AmpD protein
VAALSVASDGWLSGVRRCESPNFDARPPGELISLIVIHGISLPPGSFGSGCVEQLFCNTLDRTADPYFESIADLRVSSHFLIDRLGQTTQFVSCVERAWHAGVSQFGGRSRCNDFSIGIELEGTDDVPYEANQYGALNALLTVLVRAFPVRALAGHNEIAPGRKTDPGPAFDWSRLSVDIRLAR